MDKNTPIGKAYIQVLPTTKGISGQLSGLFGGEGASAGNAFGANLMGTIKGVLMSAGIGAIVKEALLSGADLEQSTGGVETLFKDSADAVIANAEQAFRTAGMSANDYMETVTGFSASLLQSLEGDTEAAAKAADLALRDMSDNANKMGTDMELIENAYQGFAKQNYTMLDNLKLGYGGTKAEMQRLLKDAQALTGIKYDLNSLADVYEAIHVIQTEMGITGTTALEAATTFSGSFASMKAATGNLLAQLALGNGDLAPYFENLTDTAFTFAGNLLPMAGNILSGLPTVVSGAFSAAIKGLHLAKDNAPELVRQGVDLAKELAGAVISGAPVLAEAGWELAKEVCGSILTFDWFGTAAEAMPPLKDGLMVAFEEETAEFDLAGMILSAALEKLPQVLDTGAELVVNFADGLLQGAPDAISAIGSVLNEVIFAVIEAVPVVLEKGVSLIGSLAEGLIQNGPEVLSAIGSVLGEMLAGIVERLPDLLEQGAALVSSLVTGVITGIPLVIEGAWKLIESFCAEFSEIDWLEVGGQIIEGICQGIYNGFSQIWEVAGDLAQYALDGVAFALDIHSPSGAFRDQIGVHIPSGIAQGAEKNAPVLDDAMEQLSRRALDGFHLELMPKAEPSPLNHVLEFDPARSARAAERRENRFEITIHVHAAEGMDVKELAREVAQELAYEIRKQEESVA